MDAPNQFKPAVVYDIINSHIKQQSNKWTVDCSDIGGLVPKPNYVGFQDGFVFQLRDGPIEGGTDIASGSINLAHDIAERHLLLSLHDATGQATGAMIDSAMVLARSYECPFLRVEPGADIESYWAVRQHPSFTRSPDSKSWLAHTQPHFVFRNYTKPAFNPQSFKNFLEECLGGGARTNAKWVFSRVTDYDLREVMQMHFWDHKQRHSIPWIGKTFDHDVEGDLAYDVDRNDLWLHARAGKPRQLLNVIHAAENIAQKIWTQREDKPELYVKSLSHLTSAAARELESRTTLIHLSDDTWYRRLSPRTPTVHTDQKA